MVGDAWDNQRTYHSARECLVWVSLSKDYMLYFLNSGQIGHANRLNLTTKPWKIR